MSHNIHDFRAFLKSKKITLTELAETMGYSRVYVCQVLGKDKPWYVVFRNGLKRALIESFKIDPEVVEKELAGFPVKMMRASPEATAEEAVL